MLRHKKFVIVGLLAALVLVGSLAGLAFAQTDNGTAGSGNTLLARVAAILGIDQQKLQDAVVQAQGQMQNDALDAYLKNLVDQGKITQQQADQYKTWWQARPDTLLPGPLGRHFGMRGFRGGMGMGGGLWALPKPAPTPQASGTSF
jgi:hypothetical protein